MTPPIHHHHNRPYASHGKPPNHPMGCDEYIGTTGTSGAVEPSVASAAWDSEIDHILSFFLAGDNSMVAGPPQAAGLRESASGIASTGITASSVAPVVFATSSNQRKQEERSSETTISVDAHEEVEDTSPSMDDDEGGGDYPNYSIPPPTPGVQFYAASASSAQNHASVADIYSIGNPNNNHNTSTASSMMHPQLFSSFSLSSSSNSLPPPLAITSSHSSSSSLSSITQQQNLVTGSGGTGIRPLVFQQVYNYPKSTIMIPPQPIQPPQQHQQEPNLSPSSQQDQDMSSPISPAALIGQGENLMLPPPNHLLATATTATSAASRLGSGSGSGGEVALMNDVEFLPFPNPPGVVPLASSLPSSIRTNNTVPTATSVAATPASTSTQPLSLLHPHSVASSSSNSSSSSSSSSHATVEQLRRLAWLREWNASLAKGSHQSSSGGESIIMAAVPAPAAHTTASSTILTPSPQSQPPLQLQQQLQQQLQLHLQQQQPFTYAYNLPLSHRMMQQSPSSAAASTSSLTKTAPETAEKRAKRLERNRESARKSRRRKKEKLASLEAHVNRLHTEIEQERRHQINAMVPALQQCRAHMFSNMNTTTITTTTTLLRNVLDDTGPFSEIARSVLDFQHSSLKQLILPRYHKLLLWFALQPEAFYFAGKEEYARRVESSSHKGNNSNHRKSNNITNTTPNRPTLSASWVPGKMSSKQIGDEMTNGIAGTIGALSILKKKTKKTNVKNTKKKKVVTFDGVSDDDEEGESDDDDDDDGEGDVNVSSDPSSRGISILSPHANDGGKVWPLFCYEMSLSVDQEDRFIAAHKKLTMTTDNPALGQTRFAHSRERMAAAVRAGDHLREAMETLSRKVAEREQTTLHEILLPQQAAMYQHWLTTTSNHERCRQHTMSMVEHRNLSTKMPTSISHNPLVESTAFLDDVCQRLSEVLQISKYD